MLGLCWWRTKLWHRKFGFSIAKAKCVLTLNCAI
ncbi:Uncharacterised protein [Vibrio cholerae]|nr:Uncharacterised protein [Vibrio cholerae]